MRASKRNIMPLSKSTISLSLLLLLLLVQSCFAAGGPISTYERIPSKLIDVCSEVFSCLNNLNTNTNGETDCWWPACPEGFVYSSASLMCEKYLPYGQSGSNFNFQEADPFANVIECLTRRVSGGVTSFSSNLYCMQHIYHAHRICVKGYSEVVRGLQDELSV